MVIFFITASNQKLCQLFNQIFVTSFKFQQNSSIFFSLLILKISLIIDVGLKTRAKGLISSWLVFNWNVSLVQLNFVWLSYKLQWMLSDVPLDACVWAVAFGRNFEWHAINKLSDSLGAQCTWNLKIFNEDNNIQRVPIIFRSIWQIFYLYGAFEKNENF